MMVEGSDQRRAPVCEPAKAARGSGHAVLGAAAQLRPHYRFDGGASAAIFSEAANSRLTLYSFRSRVRSDLIVASCDRGTSPRMSLQIFTCAARIELPLSATPKRCSYSQPSVHCALLDDLAILG